MDEDEIQTPKYDKEDERNEPENQHSEVLSEVHITFMQQNSIAYTQHDEKYADLAHETKVEFEAC